MKEKRSVVRMENVVSFRLDDEYAVFLGRFAKERSATKAKMLRELLEEGRKMEAVQLYRKGRASLGKASEVAGVSVSEFMDLLSDFGVPSNLSLEDFKESTRHAKELG